MAIDHHIEELGLLDGLEDQAREERADLLAWLIEKGYSLNEIRRSLATPLLLPANRVFGDDATYVSAREICQSTGMELGLLQRLYGAVGRPRIDDADAAVMLRADGEAVARAKFFIDIGVDPDETVALMRVLIEGLGYAAAMMRDAALNILLRPGGSEIELAQAAEELARRSAPQLGPMVEDLLFMQLRTSFQTEAVTAAERAVGKLPGAHQITVAFADVAGFTRLGEVLPPLELARVASRLAEAAQHAAVTPVRFVKSVGDAVMLMCIEPAPLLSALLALADGAKADGLPRLRIGVASGLAVTRGGDWFGSAVNLASRVTAAARPGTVMVAESTREAIGNISDFKWSAAGARQLKGVSGKVNLFRLHRAASADS
ncbi:adenylate cyclase CyaA [Mycobacterium lentiflavum]|uniref:Adenylate cyclase CyaA n=1 Tax=Mycobacterium lentiflavum TaxID=141349 RepID=A0A0E4H1Q7_MYCLN|nr:adenylate/guanylate cyclase domain-containing protein [Mycobacterium lentiflavum]CQD23884.1 adenylate cyclase CyaA [Mycobacterium lentiflavum]